MYYIYNRKHGNLITKTNNPEDLKKYLPELVEIVFY